jgi:hypothetical protein
MKNKVKNAIKESNEEKDSLFKEIKFKSQAAMEYLMTYGWAILIIALTLAVLYSLGIMNPKNFLPRAPPGSCFVFRPNGPGTTDFISLQGTCGYLPMYVASFNGVNAYIEVPHSGLLTVTNELTAIVWVNLVNPNNNQKIVGKSPIGSGWVLGIRNGIYPEVWDSAGTPYYFVGGAVNPHKWTFLAMTWKTGDRFKGYINGVVVNDIAASTNPIGYTTNPLRIGCGPWTTTSFLVNGSVANVQIYNTALTPQEIQYLYQQGLGGGPIRLQNLVGWWPLNGDAKDYSGNNNHGTIYGGVTFVQNYNPP